MATNNDPDENDVLDLVMARREIAEIFALDGMDEREARALAALDAPINHVAHRVQVWHSVLSLMRNGLTRHTGYQAKEADITIVIDRDRQVVDVIQDYATA